MVKKWLQALGVGLGFLLVGCESVLTTNAGAIGVEREQTMFSLLSPGRVHAMAGRAYLEALEQAQSKQQLNRRPYEVKRLRRIASRLIAQVRSFRPDAGNWAWEVNLIDDPQLNAYCMPGGKIMFYSGIIDTLSLTDDEIAAIMGHEMAHALREHGREAMSQAYALLLGELALSAVFDVDPDLINIGSIVVNYALTLPNSRTNEAEADLIGLELMARAGYDPEAAISLWQKISVQAGQSIPEFMSTHPAHDTRISGLRANIPKVELLYRTASSR